MVNADTEARADDEPSADKVEARADDIIGYDEPNELCVVCSLSEEDDEEQETGIQCTQCFSWVHDSCLPIAYPYALEDEYFLYPHCHAN